MAEKYFEINKSGQNIRCKLYLEKGAEIKRLIFYVHGFAGHKDNGTARKLAERVLSKYRGTALMTFDLPAHGDDVKKRIKLSDCISYMDTALEYIKNEMRTCELYACATSFGGYLVLKYIKDRGNPFKRIALRCPAVNMAEVLKNTIMKAGDSEELRRGKTIKVGFDRKIELGADFIGALEENDIQKLEYYDFSDNILIVHGTKDEIVPYEVSKRFADDNLIEFITVENADHRFQDPKCIELALKSMLAFYGF